MANVTSIERRDEHTRVEHLDDGTHRLMLQRGQHYFDRDTNRFEDSPAGVTSDAQVPGFSHRYKAQHWSRFGRGQWKIGFGQGRSIAYRPRGAANVAPVSSGRVVTYRELWPGVDLELTAFPEGVKEDLILKAPGAPASFVFDVELSGVILVQDGPSLQALDTLTGQPIGRVPAPTIQDAAGVEGPATLTYAAGAVTIAVDPSWLADPARVWPVTLDPTTVVQPDPAAGVDAWINSGSAYVNTNYGTDTNLRAGNNSAVGTYAHPLLKLPVPSIPAGATVSIGRLELYLITAPGSGVSSTPYGITATWDEATVTWNNQPAKDAAATGSAVALTNAGWYQFDIPPLVEAWGKGTRTNYGLYLWSTVNTSWGAFCSSDYTTDPSLRPKLTVSYNTPPTVTATSPLGTLAAPGNVSDDLTPQLSWAYSDPDGDAQQAYHVDVFDAAGNTVLAYEAGGAATSYTIPASAGLKYGSTYWWRVKVYDGAVWSVYTTAQYFRPTVSAPTGLTTTADAANARINLAWTAHTGENLAGYRVYRRKTGGATWTKLNQALAATNSYTDDAAVSGQSYDYAVSAVATDGYESPLSGVATGSVVYADTWIDDVKLTALALTDQVLPFLGSVIPVHGKATPVVFGRQAARRRTLAGTADGSQAMADLERVLAAGQTHRYADPAQAFRFIVVGDLRAQRTYPVTDASGNAMEQFDWSVDVGEVA